MNQDFDFNEIEKYAKGEMDEFTLKVFLEKMQGNEALAKEAAFYKKVAKVVETKNRIKEVELKKKQEGFFDKYESLNKTESLSKDIKPDSRSVRLPYRKLITYAASIVILMGVSLLWYANLHYSNNALSKIDKSSFDIDIETRTTDSQNDIFQKGFDFFNSKNYPEAITFFQKIISSQSASNEAQLFLSLALYYNEEYNSAINTAENLVQNSEDISIKQKAEWIIVKSMLSNDPNQKKIEEILNNISKDDNHLFQDKAKTLQNNLKSFWRNISL